MNEGALLSNYPFGYNVEKINNINIKKIFKQSLLIRDYLLHKMLQNSWIKK